MRRALLLGSVISAVALVAQGPPAASPVLARAQGTERLEFRSPPPSCEQAISELGLEGQPVRCIQPPAPTYDPPRMHGKYRLFPESYVGPLTYEDMPDTAPPGVVSDDLEFLKTSSMYVDPAWLPDGYALSSIKTNGYDSEHIIVAAYTGPGEPIQVSRVRRFTWPLDLILPVGDSQTVFETPVLDGKEAVLYYPKRGSSPGFGQTVLSFADGSVETSVFGEGLHPETASRLALSLICGMSCLPSAEAAGAEERVGSPAGSPQRTASLSSGDGTSTSQTIAAGFQVPNEHRVVVGLALSSVRVTSSWGHASGYGEAALDLQHPSGPDYTKGVNVYVSTWPWSGDGVLRFITEEYRITSQCDGRYVRVEDMAGSVLGKLTYVHLNAATQAPVNDTWVSNAGYWTIRYVGQVAETQDPGCVLPDPPGYSPHLHQGQTVGSPGMRYNTALTLGIIDPTDDPANNWMFRVLFTAPDDSDGDGCADEEELPGALPPKPGATGAYDPYDYWDFYDVPVPANPDPIPNGTRSKVINTGDVLATLLYVGTQDNGPMGNGVDYDSLKDGDWTGDTIVNSADHVGRRYDRSPSAPPNPPWNAGPPDGTVSIGDVLAVLAQVGLDCSGPPPSGGAGAGGASGRGGGSLLLSLNSMAVDAVSGGGLNVFRQVMDTDPFDIDVVLTEAGEPYAGYDVLLEYNDSVLEFVPAQDLDGDTAPESWTYTGLGGANLDATVMQSDFDGDTALDRASGGSARSSGTSSATGAAITASFRCKASGIATLRLLPVEGGPGSSTLGVGGGAIDTALANANIWCYGIGP